jgi:hypothetical protein
MMQTSTGHPSSWLHGADPVLGWAAIYWVGDGPVRVYTSIPVDSLGSLRFLYEPVATRLPNNGLQEYYCFHRQDRHLYTIDLNGYDVYYLLGRDDPVYGFYLSDTDWSWLAHAVRVEVYGRRGLWGQDFDDWLNKVPT